MIVRFVGQEIPSGKSAIDDIGEEEKETAKQTADYRIDQVVNITAPRNEDILKHFDYERHKKERKKFGKALLPAQHKGNKKSIWSIGQDAAHQIGCYAAQRYLSV